MQTPTTCQLIVDPPAEGAWNMAVDEALLQQAALENQPTLRIYQWQRPTLSLGYFQKFSDRLTHPPSLAVDVVRRLSGGGAILHDQEITYSLALPVAHPWAMQAQTLVNVVHKSIVHWLNRLSNKSATNFSLCEIPKKQAASDEPFLCFQRRSPGDVLWIGHGEHNNNHKVVGSAQRRRREAVLQHGSILWNASSFAPELTGCGELLGKKTPFSQLINTLIKVLSNALQLEMQATIVSRQAIQTANDLHHQKYTNPLWTERR